MDKFFRKYSCVKQQDTKDCAAGCIATVCKNYGLTVPISKIRDYAGTDKQGTSVLGIIKALEKLGFTAKGFKAVDKKDLFSQFPVPCIVHVVINKFNHFMVIHKVTESEVVVADPARGIIKYTPKDFFEIWSGNIILMLPKKEVKKDYKSKNSLLRFMSLLKTQKKLLVAIFVVSIIITIMGIGGTFYFKIIFDDILPNNLIGTLKQVSIGFIVLSLCKVIIELLRSQMIMYLGQNVNIPLMLGYNNHVLNSPMKFFKTREVGEIISRYNDASKIREVISDSVITLFLDSLMVIFGGIILFTTNNILFGITVIPAILYLIIVCIFRKPIESVNRETMEYTASVNSYLIQSINGIETIKAFNGEKKTSEETEKRFMKLIKTFFKLGTISNLEMSIKDGIRTLFVIIILWVGSYEVLSGNLSIGELLTYNALLVYFLEPIQRIVNLQSNIQSAMVASDRLMDILDLELEQDDDYKVKIKKLSGHIEYRNVNFRYGAREYVLKDINLNIPAGQKVAFVGESGSGKTTLVKLLMSFYSCEDGEILVDKYNLKDINKEALRDRIAYISQRIFFFSGTIKENLRFVNKDITLEEMIQSCKQAQIHDYINELPQKYDTMLEENAVNLSEGQRQRLAIARALLKKPDILIMDEATSNLDSITEKTIERTISQLSQSMTTIIVTHRLSTLRKCNKLYVMKSGRIVEEGSHEELLANKGYYYSLWSEQMPESISCLQ